MDAGSRIDGIVDDFEFLDDWDDRYKYLIELGDALPPFDDAQRNAANKVQGCVSQVWLVCRKGEGNDPVLDFVGDSDAHIVKGLVAIVLALFSGRPASVILATDEKDVFERLRLQEHITPQRSNGLKSMVARIKGHAREAIGAPA